MPYQPLPEFGLQPLSLNPRAAARAVLLDEGSYATTLIALVIDRYGDECLNNEDGEPWHPGMFRTQIEKDYALVLPKVSLDKIMAAVSILTTNYFFRDVNKFVAIANILSGDDFQPDEFEIADALECGWAIFEAVLLSPPEEGEVPFSEEIQGYISQVLLNEGFVSPPPILRVGVAPDFSDHVRFNFGDDPEMFSAIYEVQQGKSEEITSIVRDNAVELLHQLEILPLREGNTADISKKMEKVLSMVQPAKES